MDCTITIDEGLLRDAQRALGTRDAQTTVEASLRQVVRTHGEPVDRRRYIRSEADLQQFVRDAQRPRTAAEQARWDVAVASADHHRASVGPDFRVVEELRELRRRLEDGLPAEMPDDG